MKFQDSSFNGLKVTVGTKSVTHAPTNGPSKSNMPHQLFQSWGHNDPTLNHNYCTSKTLGSTRYILYLPCLSLGQAKTQGTWCIYH